MALIAQNLAAVLNKTVDFDIQEMNNPRVSCVVALFLLSLVFLVLTHGPLVHALAWVILNGDHGVFTNGAGEVLNAYVERRAAVSLGFGQPIESLEQALDASAISVQTNEDSASELSSAIDDEQPSTSAMASRTTIDSSKISMPLMTLLLHLLYLQKFATFAAIFKHLFTFP